jgi:uncharacterized protein (TIGR02266 family)
MGTTPQNPDLPDLIDPEDPVNNGTNSRRFARFPLDAEVEVGDGQIGGELHFDSQNVSQGGLFLGTDLLLEVGETYWISFALPGTSVAIRTRGRVVWVNKEPDENDPTDRPGMGVKFLDLTDAERAALASFLQKK